jgi:hypothetical protein
MPLGVVAGVHDDREPIANDRLEAFAELRPADASGKLDDPGPVRTRGARHPTCVRRTTASPSATIEQVADFADAVDRLPLKPGRQPHDHRSEPAV